MNDDLVPYTKEEIREEFLDEIRGLVKYWNKVDKPTVEEKLSGLAFSILVLLDGCNMSFPSVDLLISPHPDDEEYHKQLGERWYPDGLIFNDDVMLHDLFYNR